MQRTRIVAASGCLFLAALLHGGSLLADFREMVKSPQYAVLPDVPRVLGSSDGLTLVSLKPREIARAREILDGVGTADGAGADVAGLQLFQTYYLDSACPFPAQCQGPCNEVTMIWTETARNIGGVRIIVDGRTLGSIAGLALVPGINGVRVQGVNAGSHTFRAEDISGGTADEATITVLDNQPFKDADGLKCEPAGPGETGKCLLLAAWKSPDPMPAAWDLYIDNQWVRSVSGQETLLVENVDPGPHKVEIQGFTPVSERAIYVGCYLETACDIACTDGACDPPVALRLCQSAYSAESANTIRAEWINGENPYGVGISGFIDGVSAGTLPTDPTNGSPISATFGGLSLGARRIGVQGVCKDPELLSAITEGTITLLETTPHTNPVDGEVTCTFDPNGPQGPTTTATWVTGAPSFFIDVYVVSGQDVFYLGAIAGDANAVNVTGTTEGDLIRLQFFANMQGGCYGSELIGCGAPQGKRYVQGVCNGVGTADGRPLITSAIYGLSFLFSGGPAPPCAKACDSNGDGNFDLSDMVHVLNYLFLGGPAPLDWKDGDQNGSLDPTCMVAKPEDDCQTGNDFCSQ